MNAELGRARRDWTLVHQLRSEQRDAMGALYAPGGSGRRRFCFLRKWCAPWNRATRLAFEEGTGQKVYVRVNPFVKSQQYVGRHAGPAKVRDQQHLYMAGCVDPTLVQNTLYSQRFAAAHGGPGMWIDLPVYICPQHTSVTDTHRLEQRYVSQIGTLNTANRWSRHGTRHRNTDRKRNNTGKITNHRRRPVQRIRGSTRNRSSYGTCAETRPTSYRYSLQPARRGGRRAAQPALQ